MSIRVKLTIVFLAFVILPLLFVSLITFTNYEHSLEIDRLAQMEYLTGFKAERIEAYFSGLKTNIEMAQNFYNIRKNLPILIRYDANPGNPEALAAKKMLDTQLSGTRQVLGLTDIMLADREGRIVYVCNPHHKTKDFLKLLGEITPALLKESATGLYFSDVFFSSQSGDKPQMLAVVPAFDLDNAQIGLIIFETDMTALYRIVQDTTGLGATGEILIGKKQGREIVYLNPLRHDPATVLSLRIQIGDTIGLPIQKAVLGETGIGQSVDYRDEKVIAAWRPIPALGWGLVAKIDSSEAFASVINLRRLVIMILGIVFILAAIIVFSVTESIARPIKMLSRGAEIIGGGNLDHRVGTDMKDEIGRLSRSFDKMTHDLKATTASRDELNREVAERKRAEEELQRTHAELENRVQERTAELVMINKELAAENMERKRAEEALHVASLYARSLIEASLDPLVTISPEGKITDVNQATELATGVSRAELIGSDFSSYFTEPQKANAGYRQVIAEGFVKDYPLTIRHISGRTIDVLYNATLYKNQAGQIQGVFAAARDITKRKEAQEKISITNALLELFIKKSSRKAYLDSTVEIIRRWSACGLVGIRIKDDNGNIPYESQVGFDEDFLTLENGLNLDRDQCICARTIAAKAQEHERRFLSAGGSFFCNDSRGFLNGLNESQRTEYRGLCMHRGFQSLALVPIQYQGKIFGAIHLADFQKDKVLTAKTEFIETTIAPLIGEAVQHFNAETELEKYHLHLEELVEQRTRELETANQQLLSEIVLREKIAEDLARSNKDLEQFAYVASHDLQEPLRAVAGFVELLKRRFEGALDAKQKEYMRFIVEGAGRMQALINGLLEYSRVDTRAKTPEPADANLAFEHVLLNLQAGIRESGVHITSVPLPTVHIDALQFEQLLQNLIGNAIKFRKGPAPEVRVSAEREPGAWRFAVRDNGIGIDNQYQERIFLIFQRLHTRQNYPGTGIGLAICKKIVERHGGRIWVESEPDAGSTFLFTIPDKGEISE